MQCLMIVLYTQPNNNMAVTYVGSEEGKCLQYSLQSEDIVDVLITKEFQTPVCSNTILVYIKKLLIV